jgi:glycosyltransferase involved in cell wall biosynthesis
VKILFVNQFFHPDRSAVSHLLTDLAEDLTAAGEQISVICGRGAYSGGYLRSARETHKGIEIRRVRSTGFGRRTMAGRISDMLAFYLSATWAMLRAPRPDVLFIVSTPPLLCLSALMVGKVRGIPVVYGIQDLYPDIAVALGVLKGDSWIARTLEMLSRMAMRHMDRLVVLGRYAKELVLAKGIPEKKIAVLENWEDGSLVYRVEHQQNWFRRELGIGDEFVVLYSGNMGMAHEFDTILEAARRLEPRRDILFLFVGDGARRAEVEAFRDRHRLSNLRITGYRDRSELSYSVSCGDLFLVTLRYGAEGLVVPSKIYGGMAVARPVLFIGSRENDTAAVIERGDCGWIFAPGDVDGVAAKIVELRGHPQVAAEYGRRGREALERWNYRGHATDGYRQVFHEALHNSDSSHRSH